MTIRMILSCLILSLSYNNIHSKYIPLFSAKAKPQYPVPSKLIKNMDEQELQQVLVYGKEVQDTELVFKTFFHLFSQSTSQESIKTYKLDLADFCFGIKDWEKASAAYEEFLMLYPGSKEFEYAQYKAILCTFYLSLSFDRDQSGTQKAIAMCQLFLQRAKEVKFIEETQTILTSCRQRLFDHEIYVLETYLKQAKVGSALKRIEYIQKEFTDIKHLSEYIMYLNELCDIVNNPKTRPFILKVDLTQALKEKKERPTKSALGKITSFFLA
jgi:outer membrane assembly lipoprotein YfiO